LWGLSKAVIDQSSEGLLQIATLRIATNDGKDGGGMEEVQKILFLKLACGRPY
jgi:hypothetical protein